MRRKLDDDSTPVFVGKGNAGTYEIVGGKIRPALSENGTSQGWGGFF
jgi:hypothetical protein